jgi:hypothetical protein
MQSSMEAAVAGSLPAVLQNCGRTAALQNGDGARSTLKRHPLSWSRHPKAACRTPIQAFEGGSTGANSKHFKPPQARRGPLLRHVLDLAEGYWSSSAQHLRRNTIAFLALAELAAIASKLGKLPAVAESHESMGVVDKNGTSTDRYMDLDPIEAYDTMLDTGRGRPPPHRRQYGRSPWLQIPSDARRPRVS